MLKRIERLLKKEKTIVTYGSYTLLLNILGSIIGISTNLPLSAILGPAGFGTLKIVSSFFGQIPIQLGINPTLSKYIPKWDIQGKTGKIAYLLRSLFLLRLGLVTILSLVFFVFREKIALYLLKNPAEANFINLGIILFIVSYLDLVRPAILGFRNYKLHINISFLITVLKSVLGLILSIILGISGAIIATPLALITGIAPALYYLKQKGLFGSPPTPVDVRRIIKSYSIPAYLVNLTGLLGRFTTPLLALLYNRETIGYYSFALMIGSLISLVSGAMGQVFFPEVAAEHSKNGKTASFKKLQRVLFLFLLASTILIPVGILASPLIIKRFIPEYTPAIPVVNSFFFVYTLTGSLSLITAYCMAIGKNQTAGATRLISSLTHFSLSFLILKLVQ